MHFYAKPSIAVLWNIELSGKTSIIDSDPASKFHGANMGPIWSQQDPVELHVGPMNLAIWG